MKFLRLKTVIRERARDTQDRTTTNRETPGNKTRQREQQKKKEREHIRDERIYQKKLLQGFYCALLDPTKSMNELNN